MGWEGGLGGGTEGTSVAKDLSEVLGLGLALGEGVLLGWAELSDGDATRLRLETGASGVVDGEGVEVNVAEA